MLSEDEIRERLAALVATRRDIDRIESRAVERAYIDGAITALREVLGESSSVDRYAGNPGR